MVGTVLAVSLGIVATATVLIALWRYRELLDAPTTRKGHAPDYVTREELDEAIEEATKELQYEWNEWYEKFNTLHLRLAKRAKRAQSGEAPDLTLETESRPSVLHHRRLGSP